MIVNISVEDLDPKFDDLSLLWGMTDNFPEVKFDIFMPVHSNWQLEQWRKKRPDWTNDILKHPRWCKKVAALPIKNFEIALHGYYHHELDGRDTPEFLYFDKPHAKERLLLCEQTFAKAGIPFVRGFRPPRWRCSKGTIDALEELNYLFYAPDPRLVEEVPSSLIIPQIYFNTYINGTIEESSPHSRDKYCLLRSHYSIAPYPLTKHYKYLIKFLKNLQQREEVVFKFYTEIAKGV